MVISRRRSLLWLLAAASAFVLIVHIFRLLKKDKGPYEEVQARNDGHYGLADEKDVAVRLRSNSKQTEYIDKKGMHVVVGTYVGNLDKDPKVKRQIKYSKKTFIDK